MPIYTTDEICMAIYSELFIDSNHKKSTKMSVIYMLEVRMTKKVISIKQVHIAELSVNIHTKHEVSMTIYVGRRANQRKIPKWLPFKTYNLESLNI